MITTGITKTVARDDKRGGICQAQPKVKPSVRNSMATSYNRHENRQASATIVRTGRKVKLIDGKMGRPTGQYTFSKSYPNSRGNHTAKAYLKGTPNVKPEVITANVKRLFKGVWA